MARLKEYGRIITGNTPPSSIPEYYVSNDICFVKPSDFSSNDVTIIEDSEYYISEAARQCARMIPEGSILVTCIGTVGKVGIAKKEMAFNQQINAIIPGNDVDASCLAYSLLYHADRIKAIANAPVVPIINKNAFSDIDIPLPDLPTQRRIAATLDKVSEGIDLCRKMLGDLDEVVKARFVEMFGDMESNPKQWRKSTVGQECHYIKDGPHKSPPYVEDGIPFISTRNVVNGDGIDWSTAKYISEADYLECIKKCKPERGNILYSKGGTTGIAKLVETEKRFANWVHVAVLKFGEQLDGKFFECMLNMNYCYQQSQQLTKGIANRDFVLSAIAQVKIIVPPINLQRQYAEFVRQTDKSKLSVQRQLSALETLKKSLMQEYFGRPPHPAPAGATFPRGEGKEGPRGKPSPLGKVAERSEVG